MAVDYQNVDPGILYSKYGIQLYNPWTTYTSSNIYLYNSLVFDSVTPSSDKSSLICSLIYQLCAKFDNTTNVYSSNVIVVTFNLKDATRTNTLYSTTLTIGNLKNEKNIISDPTPVQLVLPNTLSSYNFFIEYNADLRSFAQSDGSRGLHWNHAGVNITDVRGAATLNVTSEAQPILKQPPVINSLSNNTVYTDPINGKSYTSVSNSDTSISIAWSASTKDDDKCSKLTYRYMILYNGADTSWSNEFTVNVSSSNSGRFTIPDLSPNIQYKVTVTAHNEGGASEAKLITIRTRNSKPSILTTIALPKVDEATINYTFNKKVEAVMYSMDNGSSWTTVNLASASTDGSITLKVLSINHSYTVLLRGRSTEALDRQTSSNSTITFTTSDIARFSDADSFIFGNSTNVRFSTPGISYTVKLHIKNSSKTEIKTITLQTSPATVTFEQSVLDGLYKLFHRNNTQDITMYISTTTNNGTYNDSEKTKTLTLTGIAKTGHVGTPNNTTKRCRFYIGDSNNKTKKCVCWVGNDNKSKRTI